MRKTFLNTFIMQIKMFFFELQCFFYLWFYLSSCLSESRIGASTTACDASCSSISSSTAIATVSRRRMSCYERLCRWFQCVFNVFSFCKTKSNHYFLFATLQSTKFLNTRTTKGKNTLFEIVTFVGFCRIL